MTTVSTEEIDKAFSKVTGDQMLKELLDRCDVARLEERFEGELQRILERKIEQRKPVALDDHGTPVLNDLDDLQRVATMYARSGLVPGSYMPRDYNADNPTHFRTLVARVAIAISFGKKFGMDPLTALKWVYVVNNVPSLWGDAVPGVVRNELRKRGDEYEETRTYTGTGETRSCTVTVKHTRKDGKVTESAETFSMADARKADLTGKNPWKASPDRMLLHRARTYALRNLFPDIMMGLAVYEEQDDIAEMNTVAERKSLDQRLAETKHAAETPQT
jgi:hypothetical protein